MPGNSQILPQVSRFPAGAIWLIALGCIFLLSETRLFSTFPTHGLLGFGLLGLGAWIFTRKLIANPTNDPTISNLRVFRALRGSIWLFTLGFLFLLDTFRIIYWNHSWPLLIIVIGVMTLLERTAYNSGPTTYAPTPFPLQPAYTPVPATQAAPDSLSILPTHQHNESDSRSEGGR